MKNKLKILTFLLLCCGEISAQNFSVQARADSAAMWIGAQCNVIFEICQNADGKVAAPLFSDTLIGGIEIVERKIDTVKNQDKSLTITQTYTVTSFDSALYYIPPFPFVDGNDTVFSNDFSLKVVSPEIMMDSTQNVPIIADIKPIAKAPINWQLIKKILLLLLPIWFLLAFIILFFIKYFSKKTVIIEKKITVKRPAHEVAFEKIEEIRKENIWQQGRSKEYFTQLTDVLREYIENRFSVPAFEQTSAEIIDGLHFAKKDYPEQIKLLQKIFEVSDLAKFAKYIPDINTHNANLNNAYDFVQETILNEQENKEIETENL
jgi:hypothetical protein